MRRTSFSTLIFAIILLAIGLWGLVNGGFVAIWAPGITPKTLASSVALIVSLVAAVTGIGLLWERSALISSRILLAFLLIWFCWCKGVALIHAPSQIASWESLGETGVLLAAAWALEQGFAKIGPDGSLWHLGPRLLFGLSLIAFGISHFGYVAMTASLVPSWLPSHSAWVYLTACTYIAAGLALILGRFEKLAATLASVQMALFGILVWLAKIATGAHDIDTLDETAISFALAAAAWVIASSLPRAKPIVHRQSHSGKAIQSTE